jgi:hypothetical protein
MIRISPTINVCCKTASSAPRMRSAAFQQAIATRIFTLFSFFDMVGRSIRRGVAEDPIGSDRTCQAMTGLSRD